MPLPQQWIQAFPASPRSSNKTKCGAPPQTYLARLRSRGKGRSRQMGDGAAGSSGLWRGDRAELKEQSEVVSGRPVFRDQGIGDPIDVDVLHGVRLSRGRRRDQCRALNTDPTVWQRIRRTARSDPKRAADCYSADDEVVFRDEVIYLPATVGKGSPKGLEDPPDSIPATWLLRSVSSRCVISGIGCPHLCRLVWRSPFQGIVIAPDQILVSLLFGSASLPLGAPNHQ